MFNTTGTQLSMLNESRWRDDTLRTSRATTYQHLRIHVDLGKCEVVLPKSLYFMGNVIYGGTDHGGGTAQCQENYPAFASSTTAERERR